MSDDELMPNKNGDKLYYDEYKHEELAEVIEKQKKVVEYQASDKQKILQILELFSFNILFYVINNDWIRSIFKRPLEASKTKFKSPRKF